MIRELDHILFLAVMVVTFSACGHYILFFVSQREKLRTVARWTLIVSGLLQILYLAIRFWESGHAPVISQHETIFLFACTTTWAYLSFRWRYTVNNFGTFVSIFLFVLLLLSGMNSRQPTVLVPALQSNWLPIHAGVSLLAYGFLSLAFIGGLMYLLQERELKKKRFGYLFSRLPSLDALDQLNNHCLSAGFGFLTVGIVTGSIWARQAWGTYWQWDPKETWSFITWLIYLIQLHQRYTVGWRGKRAAVMAIFGFAAVVFTLWGVTYLLGGVHSYAK